MRTTHRLTALAACAALAASATTPAIANAAPLSPAATAAVTTDSLRETAPEQQRWLSVPESRVVLNPYDFGNAGSELDQNSGGDLPLSNGYYAHDHAIRTANVLNTYVDGLEAPEHLINSDFTSQSTTEAEGWTTRDVDASYTNGKVTITNSGGASWGHLRSAAVMFDPSLHSTMTVKVDSIVPADAKWSIKLVKPGEADDFVVIQDDTSQTGTFTYNLDQIMATAGQTQPQLVHVRLWTSTWGTSSSTAATTFDSIAISRQPGATGTVRGTAESVEYSSTAAALTMKGTYSNGTVETNEYFTAADPNAYVRVIDADVDSNVLVAGAYEGNGTTYDQASNVITIRGQYATRSIALPTGATAQFYSSKSAMVANLNPTSAPTGNNGFWAASLPGDEVSVVGVGWAVNAGTFDYPDVNYVADQVAESRTSALLAADPALAATALAHWQQFWDAYLASVPVIEDFSVQRVPTGGVTADQMERFYYKAWVGLEMNVLPATPETGNEHTQLGTGKPSMWMSGTPRTKNVASWDSLLGMQQLVYTDPANAWDSFIGMIKQVKLDGDEPTDTNALDGKGALGGESLPSRKAQTAWILHQVTGDTEKLESIYEALRLNLIWSTHNMRWIYGANNYVDERDSEFVASVIYDLKFGAKIARELGHEDHAADFEQRVTSLTRDYESWFFPTTWTTDRDGNPVQWSTVQKIYLDRYEGGLGCPWSDDSEGADYYNAAGQCVKAGWSFYTTTALVAHELEDEYKTKVMQRFMRDYDDTEQLAGLGHFAVKAPDMQLITYGLLDDPGWSDYSRTQLIDYATVIVNSFNRDMVKSGWFAEVYYSTGDHKAGGTPGARGVRPSLFGISNYLDNIFIANGYRIDEGDPAVLRLAGATGGIKNLTYLGKKFDLDLQGDKALLTGEAIDERLLPATVDLSQPGVTTFPEAPGPDDGGDDGEQPVEPSPQPVASQIVVSPQLSTRYGTPVRMSVAVNATGRVPTGRVEVRHGQQLLGQANLSAGRASIALPTTLTASTRALDVTYVPTANSGVLGSTARTSLVIRKAQVKLRNAKVTKPKKSSKQIKRGKKAVVRVVIVTPSTAVLKGRVTLKAGKKILGRAKVKADKKGTRYVAKITVGKKKTRSIKKKRVAVKAIYAGNNNFAKKTLKTPIKVRR